MKQNRPREGHSLPGDRREGVKSGHRKKPTERGALTHLRPQREGQVKTRKETDQVSETHFLGQMEGQVRTRKETDRERGTYFLETTESGQVRA